MKDRVLLIAKMSSFILSSFIQINGKVDTSGVGMHSLTYLTENSNKQKLEKKISIIIIEPAS